MTEELKWLLTAEDKATPILTKLIDTLQKAEATVDSLNAKLNNLGGKGTASETSTGNALRNNLDTTEKTEDATKRITKELERQANLYKRITKEKKDATQSITEVSRTVSNGVRTDTTKVDGEVTKTVETFLPPEKIKSALPPERIKGVLASQIEGVVKSTKKDLSTGLSKISTEELFLNGEKILREYLKDDFGNLREVSSKTVFLPPKKEKKVSLPPKKEAVEEQKKSISDYVTKMKDALKINNKFVKSFGRIALYRMIRTILSSIVRLFKDGFSNIAKNNLEARESLVQLKTFSTSLSISLSSMLMPAVQALTTLLEPLSYALINNANAMAKEQAILTGSSKYYKINSEYVKDYAKQLQGLNGQLTQLDKFATLSQGTPTLGEYVDIDTEAVTETDLEGVTTQVQDFANALSEVAGFITNIAKSLSEMDLSELKALASLLLFFTGLPGKLIAVYSAIKTLFSKEATQDAKLMASAILGLATAMLVWKATSSGGLTFAQRLVATGVATATMLTVAGVISSISSNTFAAGGFPDMGSVFIANEAGAEFVGNLGSRTVVANNDQIVEAVSTGVYGAVSRAFAENQSRGSSGVYLDGKKVGEAITETVFYNGVKAGHWAK